MLSEPHWLLLSIPLIWLTLVFRPDSKNILILRIMIISVICIAMSGPVIKLAGKEGTVVVVADRSSSMPEDNDKRISETLDFLRAKMPANSRLGLVSFTDKAKIEFSPTKNEASALSVETHQDASNLADGISLALSLIPEETSGKILVLSDGLWNCDNPNQQAIAAFNRGIPIDYRYYGREVSGDLAISYLKVPAILEPKEHFIIKAGIVSPVAQNVTLELSDSKNILLSVKRPLKSGHNEFSFSMHAPANSMVKYILKVKGEMPESIIENNTAQAVSMVKGKLPVLVVTMAKPSSMKMFLDTNNIKAVELLPNEFSWNIEELSGFSAVVLENVPANALGFSGLHNISAWVKHMGGGLLLTGGKNSYGTGGYYQSPLDEVLPVSMELRSECRKMSIALAVVLDRSGSMTATVNGRTKMELADLAAASSLDLLSAMDEFTLFAVDTQPHVVVPLQSVSSKDSWRNHILSVKSQGGGIYVYDGIKAAIDVLKTAKSKTRHIILFADACDSEKPGNYWELLDDAEKHGISLSVIGLGKETDCDGNLLMKIADCGKGRCFFTDEAEELPRLFSQDTFMAAKSTFVEEKTGIYSSNSLKMHTGYSFDVKSNLNAYNICYLKPDATQLMTVDCDEKFPALAVWQYGLGRVACYSGVLDKELGLDFLRTDAAPSIFSGLVNWLAFDDRESLEQMTISQNITNGKWSAFVNLDPERLRDPFGNTPDFEILCSDNKNEPQNITLKAVWENADRLSVSYQLKGKEVVSALLNMDNKKQLRLAPACLIYSPEFLPQTDRNGAKELKDLSSLTYGKECIDLDSIWESMPAVYQNHEISNYIFLLALLLFLLEIAERRMALITLIIGKLKFNKKNAMEKNISISSGEEIRDTGKTLKEIGPSVSKSEENLSSEKSENVSDNDGILGALKVAKSKAEHRTQRD